MKPGNEAIDTLVREAEAKGLTVLELDGEPGRGPFSMVLAPDHVSGDAGKIDAEIRRWKAIAGGIGTEWTLRERPGQRYPAVTTRATAAIIAYGDGLVRWAVTFHAYTPKKPLEMRVKRNVTMGTEVEIPPPPSIEKKFVTGRVPYEEGGREAATQEAKRLCEETVAAGRPR